MVNPRARGDGTEWLDPTPEVEAAIAAGEPVVALESTIISHGMPYPDNAATARRVEATIREQGATPATIAVLGGRAKIGLDDEALERLARGGSSVAKVSRRDLALVVARGQDGATTVAATMLLAARAGIEIFATGGIGGVHRGAGRTFDISADLQELARTPVAVVCAGAKSILDLGATLEYLETRGVPVWGYGCDTFPAFFARSSGLPVDARSDDPAELASWLAVHWNLGMRSGVVVANPIPREEALDPAEIEATIAAAVDEGERRGVSGKALTPFLLQRIVESSGGASLQANRALVTSNATLGARLAKELASRRRL